MKPVTHRDHRRLPSRRRPVLPNIYTRGHRTAAHRTLAAAATLGMMLEQRIDELKQVIAGNDGHNAADRRFARAVDELMSAVYDDIGAVSALPLGALFDLFVIKVLYVGRHSRDAAVVDYLARLLEAQVDARRLFPPDELGRPRRPYVSDVLDGRRLAARFSSRYDAYRAYADSALFLSGVCAPALTGRRTRPPGPLAARAAGIDRAYYVSTGRTMYVLASRQAPDAQPRARTTLARLAEHFELYADALAELSARFIMGIDRQLVADKMLDALNAFSASGEAAHLADAGRYAALLRLDGEQLPPPLRSRSA